MNFLDIHSLKECQEDASLTTLRAGKLSPCKDFPTLDFAEHPQYHEADKMIVIPKMLYVSLSDF